MEIQFLNWTLKFAQLVYLFSQGWDAFGQFSWAYQEICSPAQGKQLK